MPPRKKSETKPKIHLSEEELERISDLAQEADIAKTRKRQYLESLGLTAVYQTPMPKPHWTARIGWVVSIFIFVAQLLLSGVSTYISQSFVSNSTYNLDKTENVRKHQEINDRITGLEKLQAEFKEEAKGRGARLKAIETEIYGARKNTLHDIETLKAQQAALDKRLSVLEHKNEAK